MSAVENAWNHGLSSASTSGITGVSWQRTKKRWRAHIKVRGVPMHLGYAKTLEAAALIRRAAEQKYFGVYAAQ